MVQKEDRAPIFHPRSPPTKRPLTHLNKGKKSLPTRSLVNHFERGVAELHVYADRKIASVITLQRLIMLSPLGCIFSLVL